MKTHLLKNPLVSLYNIQIVTAAVFPLINANVKSLPQHVDHILLMHTMVHYAYLPALWVCVYEYE